MSTVWKPVSEAQDVFEGRDRKTGAVKWTGTRVDLIFGSHSQLRAFAEVYASADAQASFVRLRRRLDQGDERGSLRTRWLIRQNGVRARLKPAALGRQIRPANCPDIRDPPANA